MHYAIFNVRITFIRDQGGWDHRRLSVGSSSIICQCLRRIVPIYAVLVL